MRPGIIPRLVLDGAIGEAASRAWPFWATYRRVERQRTTEGDAARRGHDWLWSPSHLSGRKGSAMRHNLNTAFPIIEQLRGGPSRLMVRDLTAGITVAALLVPQGMAYAELAGLPAVNGLYASFVPILAYALFGSSRQLALGPTATVAVLTATSDRAAEPREREPGARPGCDACPARWRHLHPRRPASRRVRGEFLVATGPFGLRHRGGSGDHGQPVGKNPWLQREWGHVLPAHCPRDHQPWQDPGTDGARCCIVSRVHGALASVRPALACGAHCRCTGHHSRQLVRPVRPRRRRDRHGPERAALVDGPQGRNPRPRQPGVQLVGGCAGVLCRIDRRCQGHGRPTWLCG